jgi:hypothetical protein
MSSPSDGSQGVNPFEDLIRKELDSTLDPSLQPFLDARDGAAHLLRELPKVYGAESVMTPAKEQRAWELVALHLRNHGRPHEGMAILAALYRQMLTAQLLLKMRVHKGMPLVWMSDIYAQLGFPVLAKRYLMLTLCEDAVASGGAVSPETSGVYFRMVWAHGVSDAEFRRYANEFSRLQQDDPENAIFPEWLLQNVDQGWMTEAPSTREASVYAANTTYIEHLLANLGEPSGKVLEQLADYLMSCMPGCRTARRQSSESTDYDLVCAVEGIELDFRSELGRYFVCECKDWAKPANFTTMAKFCRVLDSVKARFGILFSRHGISGAKDTTFAAREQLKVFQDRGIVIIVFDEVDVRKVAAGENMIQILRQKYEAVRLDLRPNS